MPKICFVGHNCLLFNMLIENKTPAAGATRVYNCMAAHRAAIVFLCVSGSVKKPIDEFYGFVLLAVNDFGIYLCHAHIGMAKQFARGVKVCTES